MHKSSINHPFGRENEVSILQLFKTFCNNLYLGQWELARACLAELYDQRPLLYYDIEDVLQKTTEIPTEYSLGSTSLSTPSHLAWLSLQELRNHKGKDDVGKLYRDVEFKLLLSEACTEADSKVVQELYSLHCGSASTSAELPNAGIQCGTDAEDGTAVKRPSADCLQYMSALLLTKPMLGHALLQFIVSDRSSALAETLSKLHLQCLSDLLLDGSRMNAELFYQLLALFDPPREHASPPFIAGFFADLIANLRTSDCTLNLIDVYSALLARDTPLLLDLFSRAEFDHMRQTCLNDVHTIGLTDLQRLLLSMVQCKDRRVTWHNICMTGLRQKTHFLDSIMETSMALIKNDHLDDLHTLLESIHLHQLKPLVLLVGWDHCTSVQQARSLLDTVSLPQKCALLSACEKLQRQVYLAEWCLDRVHALYESDSEINIDKTAFFCCLESHSLLETLRQCCILPLLNSFRVLSFLSDQPTCAVDDPSPQKSVRFAPSDGTKLYLLNVDHETDIALYRSYCALQSCLRALSFSPSSPGSDCDLDTCQRLYTRQVTKVLDDASGFINHLFPTAFRLEILENVFSLLFLTYADVADEIENGAYGSGSSDHHQGSANTAASVSSSCCHIGFTAHVLVVRDVLLMLKQWLIDLSACRFSLLDDENQQLKRLETELSGRFPQSITPAEFAVRLSSLTQCVSEALWRFQLVSHDSVPAGAGEISLHAAVWHPTCHSCRYSEEQIAERKKYKVQQVSLSTTDSESQRTTDGSASAMPGGSSEKVCRKWKRSRSRGSRTNGRTLAHVNQNIISRMLSSKETLVMMCVKESKFDLAKQVIQLFKLEETDFAAELTFVQLYLSAVKKIHFEDSNDSGRSQCRPSSLVAMPTKQSLYAIASVAAAAVASMGVMATVDQVLGLSNLPPVPADGITLPPKSPLSALHLDRRHLPAMIITDLAVVACRTWQSSHDLLQVARNRLATDFITLQPPGVVGFMSRCLALSQLGAGIADDDDSYLAFYRKSTNAALLSGTQPLEDAQLRCYATATIEISRACQAAVKAMNMHGRPRGMSMLLLADVQPNATATDSASVGMAMEQLMTSFQRHLPADGLMSFLSRFPSTDGTGLRFDYMTCLYKQLKNLSTLLTTWQGDDFVAEDAKYCELLEESPTNTLARLIFEKQVSPESLELTAEQLHINLVQVIANSCCPLTPYHCPVLLPARVREPCAVVPESCTDDHAVPNPLSLVEDLLTKLIQLMEEQTDNATAGFFNLSSAASLANCSAYQSLMRNIDQLERVDLCLLVTQQQKLSFYANLINLMSVHAFVLEVEKQRIDVDSVKPSVLGEWTALDSILMQHRVECNVGQLALVSLYDLRHVITRMGCDTSPSVHGLASSRWHSLDPDDPWSRFAPEYEPLLAFCLCDFSVTSPALQVFHADTIDNKLTEMTRAWLIATVHVDVQLNQVQLPILLVAHYDDIIDDLSEPNTENFDYWRGLVSFVTSRVDGELTEKLQSLLAHNSPSNTTSQDEQPAFQCCVQESLLPIGCVFDMSAQAYRVHQHVTLANCPDTAPSGSTYMLTSTALDYVSDRSALFATLISFISRQQDAIENCHLESHFQTPVEGARCPMLGVHERCAQTLSKATDRFPALSRHMHLFGGDTKLPDPSVTQHAFLTSDHLRSCVRRRVRKLCGQWPAIVALLDSPVARSSEAGSDWTNLRDFARCCDASSDCTDSGSKETDRKFTALLGISTANGRARAVLANLDKCHVDLCLHLLEVCASDVSLSDELVKIVHAKLDEMKVFKKVIQCSTAIHVPSLDQFDTLPKMNTWQTVQKMSYTTPETVLKVLLQDNQFDIANYWADAYNVGQAVKKQILEAYITSLLDNASDHLQIYQLLEKEKYEDEMSCVSLCENLLSRSSDKQGVLFIADFMQYQLTSAISLDRCKELCLLTIGCRAILCLPESSRSDYDHLVAAPWLLLEQLILNMKIDWAGKVLASMRDDIAKHPAMEKLTSVTCNQLIVKYATKALEFSVVQYDSSGSLHGSRSRVSMAPSGFQHLHLFSPPSTDTRSLFSSKSVSAMSTCSSSDPIRTKLSRTCTSLMSDRRASPRRPPVTTASGFVMPLSPPSKAQWTPDAAASVCMVCQQERFSMLNRRHHCRRCGRVVCGACSTRTTVVRGSSMRTCDECYQQSFQPRGPSVERTKMPQLSEISPGHSTSPGSGVNFLVGSTTSSTSLSCDTAPGFTTEFHYSLSLDEDVSAMIRDEFYFDHAPSTSLCLSILALHSDVRQCAHVILDLCDKVSMLLRPIAPGVNNPEVDYGLVISMLKYLLFNAKVRFLQAGDNMGAGRCELYRDRVNLLDMLVTNNCCYVPSIQQLTKIDSLGRLRDMLIEDERLSLAMDMSTKCGLDPSGVWAAWGFSCLMTADYVGAREKFSRCLKAPLDKSHNLANPKLLNDVIDALLRAPPPGGRNSDRLLSPVASIKSLLAEPAQKPFGWNSLDAPQMQECLFYLNTYGNHASIVEFFRKHNHWLKAAEYILAKHCSTDVFVDGLLMSSLTSGHLEELQAHLLQTNPTLTKWAEYLTAACRHLAKHRHINVLYQLQLFMKDYIRASMTCINYFYENLPDGAGCNNYVSLFYRLHHLSDARQHLETYLTERQWVTATSCNSASSGNDTQFRLIRMPTDVTKNIHRIDLQVEVTKFLNRYHDNLEQMQLTSSSASGSQSTSGKTPTVKKLPLPTLFGSTRMKAEVASLIMLCGNNVNDGFGLSFRIVQDFKLDATCVYTDVGCEFSRRLKFGSIRQLLGCIRDSGLCTDRCFDDVTAACLRALPAHAKQDKEVENLIKLIRLDENKVDAYILCGKLRSAYLTAVKGRRVDAVRRVASEADRLGQAAVKSICEKWLHQHHAGS